MRLRRSIVAAALGGTLALGGMSGTALAADGGQIASTSASSTVPGQNSALDDPAHPYEFVGSLATSASTAQAADAQTTARTATSSVQVMDPGPECSGNESRCWEYYDYYWTYSTCHAKGQELVRNNQRWSQYNCAGDHGLVVWLWLYRA